MKTYTHNNVAHDGMTLCSICGTPRIEFEALTSERDQLRVEVKELKLRLQAARETGLGCADKLGAALLQVEEARKIMDEICKLTYQEYDQKKHKLRWAKIHGLAARWHRGSDEAK